MKKKGLIIIGILVVGLVIFLDSITPTKIDWTKTYHENKKKPFDLKVFYEQLDTVFYDYDLKILKETFYEHHNDPFSNMLYNGNNHIYVNIDNQFEPDKESENKLLDFISAGNTAFISADWFSSSLLDSLGLQKNYKQEYYQKLDSLKLSLKGNNESLIYTPKLKYSQTYFRDSANLNILGHATLTHSVKDSLPKNLVNFIKIPYKFGYFFLHTQPEIFTNYELLKTENTHYINHLLSTLSREEETQLKDQFTRDKNGQFTFDQEQNNTFNNKHLYLQSNYLANQELINDPLRFVKSNKELNLAWILILTGVGLFLIINSKRKQRIIPFIPKVKNTSLEFVETIATLYEEADNFQPIIEQKIYIFYKNIRSRYNIVTDNTNSKLASQLSKKSGYDVQKAKELIRFINTIKNRETSSINLLTKLNTEIENFYKNTTAWKN